MPSIHALSLTHSHTHTVTDWLSNWLPALPPPVLSPSLIVLSQVCKYRSHVNLQHGVSQNPCNYLVANLKLQFSSTKGLPPPGMVWCAYLLCSAGCGTKKVTYCTQQDVCVCVCVCKICTTSTSSFQLLGSESCRMAAQVGWGSICMWVPILMIKYLKVEFNFFI